MGECHRWRDVGRTYAGKCSPQHLAGSANVLGLHFPQKIDAKQVFGGNRENTGAERLELNVLWKLPLHPPPPKTHSCWEAKAEKYPLGSTLGFI